MLRTHVFRGFVACVIVKLLQIKEVDGTLGKSLAPPSQAANHTNHNSNHFYRQNAKANSLIALNAIVTTHNATYRIDLGPRLESTLSITSEAEVKAFTQEHIRRLHRYNDLRDMGQVLGGRLADVRSVPLRSVFEEFGVDHNL